MTFKTMCVFSTEKLGSAAGGEAVSELKQLFSLAEKFGYTEWIQFDASVVRGLAYYTGIVFEVTYSSISKVLTTMRKYY